MSETDEQEVLLMAIEYLRIQYDSLQKPCVALYISRYYHLLSSLNVASNKKKATPNIPSLGLICISPVPGIA